MTKTVAAAGREPASLTPKKRLFGAATSCGVEGSVTRSFRRDSSWDLLPQLIGTELAALGVALQANSTPGYRAEYAIRLEHSCS
jgi:hypothetical protein